MHIYGVNSKALRPDVYILTDIVLLVFVVVISDSKCRIRLAVNSGKPFVSFWDDFWHPRYGTTGLINEGIVLIVCGWKRWQLDVGDVGI